MGDQFAGSKGPAWISQRAQLQGEPDAVLRSATPVDMNQVIVCQKIMAQQRPSTERSSGFESGAGSSANTNVEKFDRTTGSSSQGLEERSSTGQSQRISEGHDRQAGTTDQVAGSLGGALGGAGRGATGGKGRLGSLLPNVSGTVSVNKTGTQTDNLR